MSEVIQYALLTSLEGINIWGDQICPVDIIRASVNVSGDPICPVDTIRESVDVWGDDQQEVC